tara:strand:+ start:194 stop:409 length:216 start_codon:yes stop_codon:yes gene_type:complete
LLNKSLQMMLLDVLLLDKRRRQLDPLDQIYQRTQPAQPLGLLAAHDSQRTQALLSPRLLLGKLLVGRLHLY